MLGRINGKWVNNPNKQVQECIIALKIKKTSHLPVKQVFFQKHLGIYPDGQLNFCEYLNKVNARILQKGKQNNYPICKMIYLKLHY